MGLEESDKSVDEVMRVRSRSLQDNYEPHDLAQDYFETRCEGDYGAAVVQHGDDARYADEILFGEGPDVAVFSDPSVLPDGYTEMDAADIDDEVFEEADAFVEVKSKRLSTGQEWFGRLNLRHWQHYCEFAATVDVDVYIYFALIDDTGDDDYIARQGFIEVDPNDSVDNIADIDDTVLAFPRTAVQDVEGKDDLVAVEASDVVGIEVPTLVEGIPSVKGNDVVELNEKECRSWPWFAFQAEL